MAELLSPGMKLTLSKKVEKNDTAAVFGSGLLDVLSTPAMIALMEQTAMKTVEACLNEGEGTVGTQVCVKHIKATPVGREVSCTATLMEIVGNRLLFNVEASDDKGLIGEGIHERFIIENDKFMAKLKDA